MDVVFVGPYDLSSSMGQIGKVDYASIRETVDLALAATARHGKIAGIFLIVVLAAAAAAALLVIIPRYIALRRQGYRYSIFNRAFWSKRHRPPPPSSVRHTTQTSARARTSDAQQPSQTREDRANQRGGFGSGTGLRNRH